MDGLNSRLDIVEETVSELENRFEEIISHNAAQREKHKKKKEKIHGI